MRLQAEALEAALREAQRIEGPEAQARAAAALAKAYLRMNQLDSAARLLQQARSGLVRPRERAAAALDLGQVELARRRFEEAEAAWRAALTDAPEERDVALAVELNLLRLPDAERRLERLSAAAARVGGLASPGERARHALNIAAQAAELEEEAGAPALALRMAEAGRTQAVAAGDHALAAEAYDQLGALHEHAKRDADALRDTERGLAHAQHVAARELAVPLEWRAARLAQRSGRGDHALAAYRRAVEHVEAVRADIPVQYFDGRSSFRETLAPVYLGFTEALLRESDAASGSSRQALLRQARDAVELVKQTELEDYLRDRCTVGAARSAQPIAPPPATAIWYPIILPERLELLLETAEGIERFTVAVSAETLRRASLDFVDALRARRPVQAGAERLYRWLVAPMEARLAERGVRTLVAVPDGVLRLVPLAALHDGRDFLLRRLTVATVPGLTMTAAPRRESAAPRALLAGMSEPGPVLERLPAPVIEMVLGPSAPVPSAAASATPGVRGDPVRLKSLRDALALPGVKLELEQIAGVVGAAGHTSLLDQTFTLAALREQLLSQDFDVVHIASHGVFGDSVDTTFIMAYDDLLTLDGLQRLLSHERFRKRPIELITLSACQTAEGDDRAPLGMSGTALKARARSALGTLWPVSDDAAQRVMAQFYRLLAGGRHAKAQALREAQLALAAEPAFRHPFFWAPFTLIGDWQ